MNPLTSFKLDDLTDEEKNFLKNNLGFDEIKGKNLVTIIKLKYYKNYGHESAANIWRTNPGNFFMEYLKRLYDTIMLSEKEISLIQKLNSFEAAVRQAGQDYSPSGIANYCYELTKEYNQFYHDFSILKEEDDNIKQFRLMLSKCVAKVLNEGMGLLGIEMPERM